MPAPRVLCINPWIYDFTAYDLWSKPLGLLSIAALLREYGIAVDFLDCLDKWHPRLLQRQNRSAPKVRKYGVGPFHSEQVPTPECLHFIPRRFSRYGLPEDIFRGELTALPHPDVIFVTSIMTYWYQGPQRVVEICREVFPRTPIVLGGIYATLMPEHAQQAIKPDYLVTGPSEQKVAGLLSDLLSIPDLAPDLPHSLDDVPRPAFDLLRKNDYLVAMASRGCPFRCTFCATYKIDSAFSQRQPENVAEAISAQTKQLNVRDVAFYDDALLIQANEYAKPLLRSLIRRNRPLRFHTPNGLHARYIDEELADLMYQSRFKTVRLSLESVAKERLRDIHNKITPGEMTRAVQNLIKAGYASHQLETYIIMGLPNQPLDEVIETLLYANSLGVQIRLSSFSPIPGTKDYDRAIDNGYFPKDADPLLTNKTIIPLFRTREAYDRFHTISQFTHMLNEGAKKGVNFFQPKEFRSALFSALDRFRDEMAPISQS